VTGRVSVTAAGTVGRNVPLEPGQVLGPSDDGGWQVVRHIADGGFSSVYEVRPATVAVRLANGPQHRALKCLWGTPAELTAIGGEAAKMAAVEGHENVLGLVSSFRFDGADRPQAHYVGLVLELAAEDLRHFAARAVPSERAWAAVFEQVAAGLDHIHSRRVVHGDIKPTNVLRIGGRFAIADFGVAAPLETTRSAGIGLARTIAFWPPESASQGVLCEDGVRRPPAEGWRATQLGDVWALAVSMHRMLTGRHITPGTTPEQQYELVCLGKYSIDDRLGTGWRQLLADCLAHDPADRVVTTAGVLRQRLAELALADDFLGVPWTDGRPRVVAVLDLGHPPAPPPAIPAAADPAQAPPAPWAAGTAGANPAPAPWAAGPAKDAAPAPPAPRAPAPAPAPGAGAVQPSAAPVPPVAGPVADAAHPGPGPAAAPAAPGAGGASSRTADAAPATGWTRWEAVVAAGAVAPGPGMTHAVAGQPDSPLPAAAAPIDPAPAAGREALLLYLTQEAGRVHGTVVPAEGLLLEATRHLADVVVPSLAQQVRDSQRAVVRLVDEHERLRVGSMPRVDDEPGRTLVVGAAEIERTRELTVVVADVTRQRDRLAQDRDRLARHRDELAGERDRLRQQYTDLARRLDRLERDQDRRERDQGAASTLVFRRPDLTEPPAVRPAVRGGTTGRPGRAAIRPEPADRGVRPRRRWRRRLSRFVLLLLLVGLAGLLLQSWRYGINPLRYASILLNSLINGQAEVLGLARGPG
jgi:hypothetical protein